MRTPENRPLQAEGACIPKNKQPNNVMTASAPPTIIATNLPYPFCVRDMASEMLDTVLWFGEVNIFLVLAIVLVGYLTLSWVVAKWRASKVQTTDDSGVRATGGSREWTTNVQTADESNKQATNESKGVLNAGNLL